MPDPGPSPGQAQIGTLAVSQMRFITNEPSWSLPVGLLPMRRAQVPFCQSGLNRLYGMKCQQLFSALLQRPHLRIAAVLGQQLGVRATLQNVASLHDQNFIRINHGRQTMGNDQGGFVLRHAL